MRVTRGYDEDVRYIVFTRAWREEGRETGEYVLLGESVLYPGGHSGRYEAGNVAASLSLS